MTKNPKTHYFDGEPNPRTYTAYILTAAVMAAMWSGAVQSAAGEVVNFETAWSDSAAAPGRQRTLALVVDIEPGWHIYSDKDQQLAGDFTPIATSLTTAKLPRGVTAGPVRYAPPHVLVDEVIGATVNIYEGRVIFYLPMTIGPNVQPGEYTFDLIFRYQACDDQVCLMPKTVRTAVGFQVVDSAGEITKTHAQLFEDYEEAPGPVTQTTDDVAFDFFGAGFTVRGATGGGLIVLLCVAALGGLLLNFTPCVLPVIPIKIMGLSRAAQNRRRCLALGASMSLGVVVFWLALGAIIAFVSGFTATNQLFGYPAFTIGVGVVIAVMAVGMCGLFAVRLPRFVYQFSPRHDTLGGSFGFGIMTAVLSTPCTAPLMGSAAAWATTQAPGVTLLTFGAIGAGMAVPYLLLAANPALVEKMPRAGAAGELIKEVMGLLMLAGAAYFIGVGVSALLATPQQPVSLLYWWPVMAMIMAAGGWLAYRTWRITTCWIKRINWGVLGMAMIVTAIATGMELTAPGPIAWVYYSPDAFEKSLAEGKVVVMDFTAEWCLNCKVLEHRVLQSGPVAERLGRDDVVPMKVDITGHNPAGKKMLHDVGSVTIPLLVVFAPDGSAVFKSAAYGIQQVTDAVDRALAKPVAVR